MQKRSKPKRATFNVARVKINLSLLALVWCGGPCSKQKYGKVSMARVENSCEALVRRLLGENPHYFSLDVGGHRVTKVAIPTSTHVKRA